MSDKNALHLAAGLAFARPPAGECKRYTNNGYTKVGGEQ